MQNPCTKAMKTAWGNEGEEYNIKGNRQAEEKMALLNISNTKFFFLDFLCR